MKLKKLLFIFTGILVIVLSFTACSNEPSIYVDKDDSPLMVYIPEANEFIKYHIDKYNASCDTTQVEYDLIPREYIDVTHHKIVKEIEEGRGPDLIFIDRTFMQRNNIKELIKDGMLADMGELINSSILSNSEQFNMDVINTGVIDDKRVFIPISYTTDIMASSKQLLENNRIELTNDTTASEFIDIIKSFNATSPEHIPAFLYTDFLYNVFISHIEVTDNMVKSTPQTISLLDMESHLGGTYDKKRAINNNFIDMYSLIFKKNILFTPLDGGIEYDRNNDSDIFDRLYNQYNVYNGYGNDMVVFQYPFTGGNTKTYPNMGFVVNINSEKRNKAIKFFEYMLSEDVQSDVDYALTIPINLDSYQLAKDKLISGEYQLVKEGIEPINVSKELYNQLFDIIEGSDCEYNHREYLNYKCFYEPIVYQFQDSTNSIISNINENLEKYNKTID